MTVTPQWIFQKDKPRRTRKEGNIQYNWCVKKCSIYNSFSIILFNGTYHSLSMRCYENSCLLSQQCTSDEINVHGTGVFASIEAVCQISAHFVFSYHLFTGCIGIWNTLLKVGVIKVGVNSSSCSSKVSTYNNNGYGKIFSI